MYCNEQNDFSFNAIFYLKKERLKKKEKYTKHIKNLNICEST